MMIDNEDDWQLTMITIVSRVSRGSKYDNGDDDDNGGDDDDDDWQWGWLTIDDDTNRLPGVLWIKV